jgi:hypothetical protein
MFLADGSRLSRDTKPEPTARGPGEIRASTPPSLGSTFGTTKPRARRSRTTSINGRTWGSFNLSSRDIVPRMVAATGRKRRLPRWSREWLARSFAVKAKPMLAGFAAVATSRAGHRSPRSGREARRNSEQGVPVFVHRHRGLLLTDIGDVCVGAIYGGGLGLVEYGREVGGVAIGDKHAPAP